MPRPGWAERNYISKLNQFRNKKYAHKLENYNVQIWIVFGFRISIHFSDNYRFQEHLQKHLVIVELDQFHGHILFLNCMSGACFWKEKKNLEDNSLCCYALRHVLKKIVLPSSIRSSSLLDEVKSKSNCSFFSKVGTKSASQFGHNISCFLSFKTFKRATPARDFHDCHKRFTIWLQSQKATAK